MFHFRTLGLCSKCCGVFVRACVRERKLDQPEARASLRGGHIFTLEAFKCFANQWKINARTPEKLSRTRQIRSRQLLIISLLFATQSSELI